MNLKHCNHECVCHLFLQNCFVGKSPCLEPCKDDTRSHSHQSERDTVLDFTSGDLLLIAHDEWKRREERKHLHDHISWVNGWISGFLTSRKFVKDQLVKLRQQAGEP
jgi:hypothetical protein